MNSEHTQSKTNVTDLGSGSHANILESEVIQALDIIRRRVYHNGLDIEY